MTSTDIWRFLKDMVHALSRDRVGLISAGIAFYGLLSLFPGIAAMMALGGLLTKPSALVAQMQQIGSVMPPEAGKIILDQATQIAGSEKGGLGVAAVLGLGLAIYSASKAVGALIMGIHVAAGEVDDRGLVRSFVFTLSMTVVAVVLALLALFSTVVLPAVLAALHVGAVGVWLAGLIRWPVIGAIAAFGLGMFYRLSIRLRVPRPRWITPGAIVSVVLWLVGSVLFSIFVQNFAHYNETFGTLGGLVSLLMWMWLSAYIVLLGEEVNTLLSTRDKTA
jgi:membrane protein